MAALSVSLSLDRLLVSSELGNSSHGGGWASTFALRCSRRCSLHSLLLRRLSSLSVFPLLPSVAEGGYLPRRWRLSGTGFQFIENAPPAVLLLHIVLPHSPHLRLGIGRQSPVARGIGYSRGSVSSASTSPVGWTASLAAARAVVEPLQSSLLPQSMLIPVTHFAP